VHEARDAQIRGDRRWQLGPVAEHERHEQRARLGRHAEREAALDRGAPAAERRARPAGEAARRLADAPHRAAARGEIVRRGPAQPIEAAGIARRDGGSSQASPAQPVAPLARRAGRQHEPDACAARHAGRVVLDRRDDRRRLARIDRRFDDARREVHGGARGIERGPRGDSRAACTPPRASAARPSATSSHATVAARPCIASATHTAAPSSASTAASAPACAQPAPASNPAASVSATGTAPRPPMPCAARKDACRVAAASRRAAGAELAPRSAARRDYGVVGCDTGGVAGAGAGCDSVVSGFGGSLVDGALAAAAEARPRARAAAARSRATRAGAGRRTGIAQLGEVLLARRAEHAHVERALPCSSSIDCGKSTTARAPDPPSDTVIGMRRQPPSGPRTWSHASRTSVADNPPSATTTDAGRSGVT
jgi:hypothetical protein